MEWAARWVRAVGSPRLLVVGGASLDRIHVEGEPVPTPGGAGLYTALAAARAGVEVTMLAPVPDPMPPALAPASRRIRWIGPRVDLDGLPRFEIAYDRDGSVTLFREHLGAEPDMTPALLDHVDDLPATAYCVPFMDAGLQRSFVDALRDRGCLTVAATYGKAARSETGRVRATLDLADLSFCNADEAAILFGDRPAPPVGHHRFVTRGGGGATVFQGDHRTDVPGQHVEALDPTGAGDTFCGTTIARLLLGDHPVEAARRANAAAAEMVTEIGPSALLRPGSPPVPPTDDRAVVDGSTVDRMAEQIAGLEELTPFPFTGDLFPAVGDPTAVEWFTATTLQQFGFWFDRDGVWERSMVARIDGADRKGSDYLWAVYRRWAHAEGPLTATRLATITEDDWRRVVADDTGHDPFPTPDTSRSLTRDHGRTLASLGIGADDLVAAVRTTSRPLRTLLTLLDHVGGYREDPLRKKAALLGVILRQRPEGFLPAATDDDAPPIVDYHVQRTCLRTGMVAIEDAELRRLLIERRIATAAHEDAVRRASHAAVERLARRSGRGMGAVDWFLFAMRHRCPEASPPRCAECPADPACSHLVDLFQPVFRTTAY